MAANKSLAEKTEITLTNELIRDYFFDSEGPVLHSPYAPGDIILRCKTCSSIIRKDLLSGSKCPADPHHDFVPAPVLPYAGTNIVLKGFGHKVIVRRNALIVVNLLLMALSILFLILLEPVFGYDQLQLGALVHESASEALEMLTTIKGVSPFFQWLFAYAEGSFWHVVHLLYFLLAIFAFAFLTIASLIKLLQGKPDKVRFPAFLLFFLCPYFAVLCISASHFSPLPGSLYYIIPTYVLSAGAVFSVVVCLFSKACKHRRPVLLTAFLCMNASVMYSFAGSSVAW